VVVAVREEGLNRDKGVKFSFGTISIEKSIIPMHSKPLAARPTEAYFFHASGKIAEYLTFVVRSFG
jgi:hypothetical protein